MQQNKRAVLHLLSESGKPKSGIQAEKVLFTAICSAKPFHLRLPVFFFFMFFSEFLFLFQPGQPATVRNKGRAVSREAVMLLTVMPLRLPLSAAMRAAACPGYHEREKCCIGVLQQVPVPSSLLFPLIPSPLPCLLPVLPVCLHFSSTTHHHHLHVTHGSVLFLLYRGSVQVWGHTQVMARHNPCPMPCLA